MFSRSGGKMNPLHRLHVVKHMNDSLTTERLLARITELETENAKLRTKLEDRKLVEKAKGVLMRKHRWTEEHSYRKLQQTAMNLRMPLGTLARKILEGNTQLTGVCTTV